MFLYGKGKDSVNAEHVQDLVFFAELVKFRGVVLLITTQNI